MQEEQVCNDSGSKTLARCPGYRIQNSRGHQAAEGRGVPAPYGGGEKETRRHKEGEPTTEVAAKGRPQEILLVRDITAATVRTRQ
jgi:hypothetical protein